MSNYYHGAKASKQATSVSTPVVADSSIHLIVGTAGTYSRRKSKRACIRFQLCGSGGSNGI